jgi:AcrR family transcriptional regulator
MPKISAPTVAEHRAAQRSALLKATEDILLETGLTAVNPRTVAERAGLSRSSFYEYFGSRDDILTAVAIDAFDRWASEIDEALAAADTRDRLRVYVDLTMRMTADGKHGIASILQQADLSPSRYEDIMALHDALLNPIKTLLAERQVPDVMAYATFVQGLLGAGVQLVTHGADADLVSSRIVDILTSGLPKTPTI